MKKMFVSLFVLAVAILMTVTAFSSDSSRNSFKNDECKEAYSKFLSLIEKCDESGDVECVNFKSKKTEQIKAICKKCNYGWPGEEDVDCRVFVIPRDNATEAPKIQDDFEVEIEGPEHKEPIKPTDTGRGQIYKPLGQ